MRGVYIRNIVHAKIFQFPFPIFVYRLFFFLKNNVCSRFALEKVEDTYICVYIYRAVIGSRQDASKRKRWIVGVHTRSHCTQAFYVRVIKHFACEGIIVGVGPCAVYTMPVRRGVARDGEGVCSLGLGAPGGYRAPFFIL